MTVLAFILMNEPSAELPPARWPFWSPCSIPGQLTIRTGAPRSEERRYWETLAPEDTTPQGCDVSADVSADPRGGYNPPRAGISLPESDKSWGRRGKAPVHFVPIPH